MHRHALLDLAAERGVRLGLDRVRRLLAFMGDPHLGRPTLHVAGTNGKGSTCTMLTAALVAADHDVGTFLSPHMSHINERIRRDGVPCDDPTLDQALQEVAEAADRLAQRTGEDLSLPTYFEMTMVAAFLCFEQWNVSAQVVEVGIGGRLDATSVVEPSACGVTSIGLDHADILGSDLHGIAREKGGIFRRGVPAVIGPVSVSLEGTLREVAKTCGAPVWSVGRDITVHAAGDGVVVTTPAGRVGPVDLALEGPHQQGNAAVAVGMLHGLRDAGLDLPDEAIASGLATASLVGRCSRPRPGLIVDGAHNADGAAALASVLAAQDRPARRVLVFGCGLDRAPADLVWPLWPHVDEVVAVSAPHPRARDAEALAATLTSEGFIVRAVEDGPAEVCRLLRAGDAVVVAGSLYLVGPVLEAVGRL